jgi:hypothetical protein
MGVDFWSTSGINSRREQSLIHHIFQRTLAISQSGWHYHPCRASLLVTPALLAQNTMAYPLNAVKECPASQVSPVQTTLL